jgi:hypothetical protein
LKRLNKAKKSTFFFSFFFFDQPPMKIGLVTRHALLSRALVLALAALSPALGPCYDLSGAGCEAVAPSRPVGAAVTGSVDSGGDPGGDAGAADPLRDPAARDERPALLYAGLASLADRWDGVHMRAVAERGYASELRGAFFPLVPWAMRALGTARWVLLLLLFFFFFFFFFLPPHFAFFFFCCC